MPIHTVLGPLNPDELGPTSMHEHVFSDLRVWIKEDGGVPWEGEITPEAQAHLRWNGLHTPDNLVLHDADVAVREMEAVKAAGGRTVVDLTVTGMGRRTAELVEVSRRSGVNIAVGCGFYVEELHPPELKAMDTDAIAQAILDDLTIGLDGTGVKPALIGEIGTNHPPSVDEWRVVEAAGIAAAQSGAAVNVHLSWRGADGLDVVERLTAAGMPAERIVLSHMDERIDREYHDAVAQTGAVLELDTFGSEFFYSTKSKARNPTDVERLDALEYLLSQGYADQIVLGCDVWAQSNLLHNGGAGYEHLFRRVQPAITWYCGGDEAAVQKIMVDTPKRLLDRP